MRLISLLLGLILNALLFSSCGGSLENSEPKEMTQSCKRYSKIKMTYDKGYEYASFEAIPIDRSSFKITKITYHNGSLPKKSHPDLKISSNENKKIFSALKDIFSGNCDISWTIPAPRKGPPPDGWNWSTTRLYGMDEKFEEFSLENQLTFILKDGSKFRSSLLKRYVWDILEQGK